MAQETVAYLGSIDCRHLGVPPDEERERASIYARTHFWEAANPKLKGLVNRAGGDDGVKRLRMAVHARIPWPMQAERERLAVLDALHEADFWHRLYKNTQHSIAGQDRLIGICTKEKARLERDAMSQISQANMWKAEARRG